MKPKLERECTQSNLSAALDETVEAAVALRISEQELIAKMLERWQKRASSKVVSIYPQPQKMFNPTAGP